MTVRELYEQTYRTLRAAYKRHDEIAAGSGHLHIKAAVHSFYSRDIEFTGWLSEKRHGDWLNGRYYRAIEKAEGFEAELESEPEPVSHDPEVCCPQCRGWKCVFTHSQGIDIKCAYISLRHYICDLCEWEFAVNLRIEYYNNDEKLLPKQKTRERNDVEGHFNVDDIPF